MRKFSSVTVNVAKNGFIITGDNTNTISEYYFVAMTLDEVKEVLDKKLNMDNQE